MQNVSVAVIGAGPSGLAALKCSLEQGFAATAFEARDDVGGIWYYSDDKSTTSCLKDTLLNSSKFISHFSDFAFPAEYPNYPPADLMHNYFRLYTDEFKLRPHIEFNTSVSEVARDDKSGLWILTVKSNGKTESRCFDKVIMASGMLSGPNMPEFQGSEKFKGLILHGKSYKSSVGFRGQNVLVVGIGNTAADVAVDLVGAASNVYLSHRRGALVLSRFRAGSPLELSVNRQTLRLMNYLKEVVPSVMSWLQDYFLEGTMAKSWEIDPSWNLKPSPSLTTTLPCINEKLIPCLAAGSIRSVKGLRRFLGPRSVELDDGMILEDVDSVVLATGYRNESRQQPWIKMAKPPKYEGPAIPRLFLQVFPPEYANSMAVLTSYGVTDNFWVSSELCSMAIAQLWSGKSQFPSRQQMESSIDRQQGMSATRWQRDPSAEQGVVYATEFYDFMHTAAGTGVLGALGWGLSGWRFWWKEREMARLLGWGVVTPFAYRLIETGKRKAWSGAREAIKKTNDEAERIDKTVKRFELDKNK